MQSRESVPLLLQLAVRSSALVNRLFAWVDVLFPECASDVSRRVLAFQPAVVINRVRGPENISLAHRREP